ncbi:E2F-associated phosphofamily protein [Theileria parva strain Muguga]|uniref:E2F-associated phosphoprotein n=1 Tax=Theileria parva TaxID=5875 RepID=Q4N739_THEPA|nr:E2F-associated phosphofamily protein [Theileria parva strain Muguga]EAN34219.1 E2F-associated phosphofamily protein [Theileria parva strain Muguga]|eukprot:XP_766502.1 hypothetical protein [Theileria parva strain Muguga]
MSTNKPSLNKIHELGITIFPEKDANDKDFEPSEDFYGSDLDDLDDDFVNDNYRQGDKSTDAVLCCAMCFTPVCYQCKTVGNTFSSKLALNAYVEDNYSDSANRSDSRDVLGKGDSTKRKLRGSTSDSERIVKCIECNNVIAVLDFSNNYNFKNVIASKP